MPAIRHGRTFGENADKTAQIGRIRIARTVGHDHRPVYASRNLRIHGLSRNTAAPPVPVGSVEAARIRTLRNPRILGIANHSACHTAVNDHRTRIRTRRNDIGFRRRNDRTDYTARTVSTLAFNVVVVFDIIVIKIAVHLAAVGTARNRTIRSEHIPGDTAFVDGHGIGPHQPVVLDGGQVLRIGHRSARMILADLPDKTRDTAQAAGFPGGSSRRGRRRYRNGA